MVGNIDIVRLVSKLGPKMGCPVIQKILGIPRLIIAMTVRKRNLTRII
jgi:hypothetical protein